jgi:pimeloyl-ACP methyl ester carboxylesterase
LPLVLIHGLLGELATPPVVAALGSTEWLAPDLVGYEPGATAPSILSLEQQADHVHRAARAAFGDRSVRIAGHSIGGAVAMVLAHRHPELVAAVISIEGNFTLEDAFWTGKLAAMSAAEVGATMDGFRRDPAGWLAGSGVAATEPNLALARRWLARQPDATIHAISRAVIAGTSRPDYLDRVRGVVDRVPIHLVAGGRTASGWHVPPWVRARAATDVLIPGAGHLMMLEAPEELGRTLERSGG